MCTEFVAHRLTDEQKHGDSHHAKSLSRLVKTIPIFCCIFLFPKVKTALKGKRFQDIKDIKKNMMAELKAVRLEAFAKCFQKLIK
jgi:hypothetical protein